MLAKYQDAAKWVFSKVSGYIKKLLYERLAVARSQVAQLQDLAADPKQLWPGNTQDKQMAAALLISAITGIPECDRTDYESVEGGQVCHCL